MSPRDETNVTRPLSASRTRAVVVIAMALASACTGVRALDPPPPAPGSPTASASTSAPTAPPKADAPKGPAAASAASSGSAATVPPADETYPDEAGGPCTYTEHPGTCTAQAGGVFVFSGKLDGKPIVLRKNTRFPTAPPLAAGASAPCSLKLQTTGVCTPCMFSIGNCGEEAFEAFRARLR